MVYKKQIRKSANLRHHKKKKKKTQPFFNEKRIFFFEVLEIHVLSGANGDCAGLRTSSCRLLAAHPNGGYYIPRHACASFPLAKSKTPASRASFPPRQIANARVAGVSSPSPLMEIGQGWNERTQSDLLAFHDGNAQTRANGAFALLMQKKNEKKASHFFF